MCVCVCKLAWGHSNFSLRNFSSFPHSEREGFLFSPFSQMGGMKAFSQTSPPRNSLPVRLSPSPAISGGSGGILQLVSDWLVPGFASTRPWSSHLWRKGRPDSRGHTAGGGKWQGGS